MIHIITPCSRPENLDFIAPTIPENCLWVIVHDNNVQLPRIQNAIIMKCEDTGKVGTKARNFALDNLNLPEDSHILFHDDDNIIHPNWFSTISQLLDYDFSLMTWGQLHKDNSVRLEPQIHPAVGNIDTASFLVKWKYNSRVRHRTDIYEHDGIYAQECANNGNILCVKDYLCYYNYLR
jgi:hypothetical protein